MRLRNRMSAVAIVVPILFAGVMVEPAQAVTQKTCHGYRSGISYDGYLTFSNATTPVVSYKIIGGLGSRTGSVSVNDYGTRGYVRHYVTNDAIQDGAWHVLQGPYSRLSPRDVDASFNFRDSSGVAVGSCWITTFKL